MQPFREMMQSFRTSPMFALAVLITLGLAGVFGLMVGQMALKLDFYLPGQFGQMAHGAVESHRVHDLTYGFLFTTAVVGMLAQLRRPSQNVAGMVMALIPWVGLLLAAVLSTDATVIVSVERVSVAVVAVIAALLHPTWRDFFRSFSVARVNWVMLALVIIAAGPLLGFASTNIRLQGTLPDDHAAMGHYGFMAAFAFTAIWAGVLASLRPDGWRLTAWVAGLLPALLGFVSLVYPDASSSLDRAWAVAAIAWGVVFVAAAELTKYAESPKLLGSLLRSLGVTRVTSEAMKPDGESPASTPRWVNAFGGIALAIVVVPIALSIGGVFGVWGGPGDHNPGQAGPGGDSATQVGGNTPPIDGAPELAITAENFAFSPDHIELNAGQPVGNVALTSVDIQHDLVVDEIGFRLDAARGETVIGGLEGMLFGEPGTYVGYCSVPGHREAGMEIEIVVGQAGPGQHTGGGDTPPAPTGTSSPLATAGSTPSSIPLLSVSGTEYSFDAPDSIAAGRTTLRFTNQGQETHELQLMRLNDGVAIHQFKGAFEEGVDAALELVSVEGGVEAIGPGQTAEVTVDLREGEYVLISLVESPDDGVPDAFKGMVKPLTVTAAP